MRIPGQTLILTALVLMSGDSWGAPQNNWYAESDRDLGFLDGLTNPVDVAHGPGGRAFVVETHPARVLYLDGNQNAFALESALYNPLGATFANGKLFVVASSTHRVYAFDENGTELFRFGSEGADDGQFYHPLGITSAYLDGEWEVYVSDSNQGQIQVFDEYGNFRRKFSSVDSGPRGLDIDQNGLLYVACGPQRVNIFDRNGNFLRRITEGLDGSPWGLSIRGNRLAVGKNSWTQNLSNVVIYDLNGTFIRQIGTWGTGDGQLKRPHGVSFDEHGNIWVADYGNQRVQIFDENGTYLSQFGNQGKSSMLNLPKAVAMDTRNFYFSDTSSNRVVVMDIRDGSYVRTIAGNGAGPGEVVNPKGIDIDANGRIYVADQGNNRIQVFENDGSFVRSFGSASVFSNLWGVAVAEDGKVYASDIESKSILVFDEQGNLINSWGEAGNQSHQLNNPRGLTIGPEGDLYVADHGNKSIKRFSVSGELKLHIHLPKHGGSINGYHNVGSFPLTVAVRQDGVIITTAPNGTYWNRIWAFDKFGNKLWSESAKMGDNFGLVASDLHGDFAWIFERSSKYRMFRSSYRAGPLMMEDAIPYPMLISATQEPETTDLDIVYKVTDADDARVTTGLLAYVDGDDSFGNVIIPQSFIGDVSGKIGQNVDVNVTHSLSWDMPRDWDASVGTVAVEVFAKDERELLDLHFVEIPADENNATPLTINRFPLQDEDFLAAYRYMLATGYPGIKLEKGVVMTSDGNSTPISPESIPGMLLWMDASDISGDGLPNSENNGTQIAMWKDKSSNEFNATQDNPDNQPVYIADDGNGKPALRFTNHWLNLNGVDFHAKEIFLAASFFGTNGQSNYCILGRGGDKGQIKIGNNKTLHHSRNDFAGHENRQWVYNDWSPGRPGVTFPLNKATVVGSILGESSHNNGHFQNMIIGRDNHDNNRWHGYIYEVLVFEDDLLPGQRVQIEWYLGQKWGVYGPCPGWSALAVGGRILGPGLDYLLDKMNLRKASPAEISRAKAGTNSGAVNEFSPDLQIQPGANPEKINEFTIETKRTGVFVVPK